MSLAKHLALQQQAIVELVDWLELERRALAQAKVDGEKLQELTACKQAALQKLEQLEAIRSGAQLKLGYGAGRQGAQRAAQDADCLAAWREVQALARRAREVNIANGEALRQRMACNQRIVGFLNRIGGNQLYGPDGRTQRDLG
ncbi:flagella synthesis protein FlgN [Pseudomonas marginalis]|uniref:flagella synthesis protein FlgN n=1 Tax=Pseudomonas TaxID=286 RepID=UPI00209F3B5A|nr:MULTISPECIES: flagellar protein FlgN [Pseudomonas]MCP1508701.1 flagella synthesis protein FlgN [Pseudomonas marginalis]MCP1526206.1 flagella synthesis protein FlgN [Pseudomonas marginalis]MDQ0498481.1 flagella synthesis protein FlgN [Pseudomonas marginalis]